MEQNQTQQLLSQLKDINGLDKISWWPLATGWWILLGLIIILWISIVFYRRYRARKEASWQAQVKSLFTDLHDLKTTKEKAAALSELMRRLAIHKYGRQSCAGLEGNEWLEWLAQHDPKDFDWFENAKILIEAPYMPDNSEISDVDFAPLIKAAERWVK